MNRKTIVQAALALLLAWMGLTLVGPVSAGCPSSGGRNRLYAGKRPAPKRREVRLVDRVPADDRPEPRTIVRNASKRSRTVVKARRPATAVEMIEADAPSIESEPAVAVVAAAPVVDADPAVSNAALAEVTDEAASPSDEPLMDAASELASLPPDLELVDVKVVGAGGDGDSPRYRVRIRNRGGRLATAGFNVTVLPMDADLEQAGATVRIASIRPGETMLVDLAMQSGQSAAAGQTLFVAVDSRREVAEPDEENNFAELEAESLPVH